MGEKYGYTGQTILNYLYGMGKDGFLKEALIEQYADLMGELRNNLNSIV